jgi:hypothetical protein
VIFSVTIDDILSWFVWLFTKVADSTRYVPVHEYIRGSCLDLLHERERKCRPNPLVLGGETEALEFGVVMAPMAARNSDPGRRGADPAVVMVGVDSGGPRVTTWSGRRRERRRASGRLRRRRWYFPSPLRALRSG